ncbi:MAG: endolytic transglycosylase MltG [Parcubacteria group bacterium]|nr:endolytic transglycosylase MltG [Parcubacteria group bacterium]
MKKTSLFVFFAFAVALAVFIAYFFYIFKTAVLFEPPVRFSVETGSGLKEIAASLEEGGIVTSDFLFKWYAVFRGAAHRLKPGDYVFSGRLNIPDVVEMLVAGARRDARVTIPEGATARDIDALLASFGVTREGQIENFDFKKIKTDYPFLASALSLEGYLFPDTYRFFLDSSPEAVVGKFLDNFKKTAIPVLEAGGLDNERTFVENVTIASLIEKEVPEYADRRLVAGILLKRLKAGMPLQVDASVCYAKSRSFENCHPLNREDFKIDSEFNTYRNNGLPPAPVSNPGLEAIKAAVDSQASDYWYYLSDPATKKTIFSKTLEEHNENRAKYLNL